MAYQARVVNPARKRNAAKAAKKSSAKKASRSAFVGTKRRGEKYSKAELAAMERKKKAKKSPKKSPKAKTVLALAPSPAELKKQLARADPKNPKVVRARKLLALTESTNANEAQAAANAANKIMLRLAIDGELVAPKRRSPAKQRSAAAFYGSKTAGAKRKKRKSPAAKPAAKKRKSSAEKPAARKRKASTAKTKTSSRVSKPRTTTAAAKRYTPAQVQKLLTSLKRTCDLLEKKIPTASKKSVERVGAKLKRAVISTSACNLAKERHPNAVCKPYPKGYKGAKGPTLLGKWKPRRGGFRGVPDLDNVAFWG